MTERPFINTSTGNDQPARVFLPINHRRSTDGAAYPEALRQLRRRLDGDWSLVPPSEEHEVGRLHLELRALTTEKVEALDRVEQTRREITAAERVIEARKDGNAIVQARGSLEVLRPRERTQAQEVARLNDAYGALTTKLATAVQRHDAIVRSLYFDEQYEGGSSDRLTRDRVGELVAESLSLVGPRLPSDDAPPPKPAPYVDPGLVALGRSLGHYGPQRVR